ncbi:hypothetical protein Pyn_13970 [Prunus yedoensis var. nudiflora]|uniref:Uncharacterized protein n=1 Tax=Prunus yedoensis var. nudiflora TaxID=2094558 RepID=A0A314YXN7_PRUYE|nr:hypothetical protein Pyn_13970 [Prunus yedoensis var. nudiflora]
MLQGNEFRHGGAEDEHRHWGAEGDIKLACCKAMCLGMGVPKARGAEGELRHCSAEGHTKLACCKAMRLGTGVPNVSLGTEVSKVKGCQRQHKACMFQGHVLGHRGAEGEKIPNATQSLHVWFSD